MENVKTSTSNPKIQFQSQLTFQTHSRESKNICPTLWQYHLVIVKVKDPVHKQAPIVQSVLAFKKVDLTSPLDIRFSIVQQVSASFSQSFTYCILIVFNCDICHFDIPLPLSRVQTYDSFSLVRSVNSCITRPGILFSDISNGLVGLRTGNWLTDGHSDQEQY